MQSEQHMVLKCVTNRVERNRMLGKVREQRYRWGSEWAKGGGAAQGKSRFGWGIILARTVGEGVYKMMKKKEG